MISRTVLKSLLLNQNILDLQSPALHIQYNRGEAFLTIDILLIVSLISQGMTLTVFFTLAVLPLEVH